MIELVLALAIVLFTGIGMGLIGFHYGRQERDQ